MTLPRYLLLAMLLASGPLRAVQALPPEGPRDPATRPAPGGKGRVPDLGDHSYGPHARHVLDLWKAESDKATPLLIFFHGGGFKGGSKKEIPRPLQRRCLEAGISFASVEYRLSDIAPYPAQMHDAARAVQYLRHKAAEFNLDPQRFAATGGSAGAGISLWLAFHEDLADKENADEVLRHSTRILGAVVTNAQCSYDPRWIQRHIGGKAHEHGALRQLFRVSLEDLLTDKKAKLYEDASPITHLTGDDPPVILIYAKIETPSDRPGGGIHSHKFGQVLQAEMQKLSIGCALHVEKGSMEAESLEFLRKCFGPSDSN